MYEIGLHAKTMKMSQQSIIIIFINKKKTHANTAGVKAIRKQTYHKRWPIHRHIDSVIIRPPFQILLMVCIVDGMIEFFINLWQTERNKSKIQGNGHQIADH